MQRGSVGAEKLPLFFGRRLWGSAGFRLDAAHLDIKKLKAEKLKAAGARAGRRESRKHRGQGNRVRVSIRHSRITGQPVGERENF
jgi:predicted sugar kinase